METIANIRVSIMNEELDINEICSPLEERGWIIESAFIEQVED